MSRLVTTIGAVIGGTFVSGLAGGLAGAAIGHFAPSFVLWMYGPAQNAAPGTFDPTEFGLGLGAVSGLFLGAGACVLLAIVFAIREMIVAMRIPTAKATKHERTADLLS